MDLITKTLNVMEQAGKLPKGFNITPTLVDDYQTTYTKVLGVPDKVNCSKRNIRQNRRLAYMNLLKYKRIHVLASLTKEGFLYIVRNPAWPDYVKIGRSNESKVRLSQMQTFSPFRDFEILHYIPCLDMRQGERLVHKALNSYRSKGEWFKTTDMVAFGTIKEILSANSIGLE